MAAAASIKSKLYIKKSKVVSRWGRVCGSYDSLLGPSLLELCLWWFFPPFPPFYCLIFLLLLWSSWTARDCGFHSLNIVCSKLSCNVCYYEFEEKNIWYRSNVIYPKSVLKLKCDFARCNKACGTKTFFRFLIMKLLYLLMVTENTYEKGWRKKEKKKNNNKNYKNLSTLLL